MNSTGAAGSSSTAADSGTTSSTASDTTGSTTAAGGSGSSGAVMAQLPGFSGINADQILSTCQGSPDKQLSEVIGSGAATAQ